MMNRHGLIAGATGTGKTKTLQLLTEQLSAAGVPVFVADIKGDLLGPRHARASRTTGSRAGPRTSAGAGRPPGRAGRVREPDRRARRAAPGDGELASVRSCSPRCSSLNETQTSVLTLVFKYCDDRQLPLLDFADLRAVLQFLGVRRGEAGSSPSYGGMSPATVGVLLRKMVELEAQGAGQFFGEPEFDVRDLLAHAPATAGAWSPASSCPTCRTSRGCFPPS